MKNKTLQIEIVEPKGFRYCFMWACRAFSKSSHQQSFTLKVLLELFL